VRQRQSTGQNSVNLPATGPTNHLSACCRSLIASLALLTPLSGTAAVNLAWDPVDDARVAVYEVWYGTASAQYNQKLETPETTAAVDNLEPGQEYFFSVRACDAEGLQCSDYSSEVTTSTPISNNPPVAVNDTAKVLEDSAGNVLDVLANDTDADGQTLTVTGASAGNGTVVINTQGSLSYSPSANFNGSDTLTYSISDGAGGTDSATVTVSVTAVNDAPQAGDDSATVTEDSTANTLSVLANDSDVDGDNLTVTGASAGYGTVRINSNGTLSYSPGLNFHGNDTLAYTVSDGAGGTDTAIVGIVVTAVNDAPQAVDDSATVAEDSGANTLSVLGNDSDVDGDNLTVTGASAANGTVAVNSNGTLSYSPTNDFHGTDSLSYTISDGAGGTDSANVTVSVTPVNDPPVAANDTATVAPDSTANTLTVLANDSDIDGDALTVTAATAANGTVSINPDGTLSYSPTSGFVGTESLGYEISDGAGASAAATVTVAVTAIDEPPVAGFTASTTTGEASLTVLFRDASSGEITSRGWLFGDGKSETDAPEVTHTYTEPGTYTVSLTVTGPGGTDEHVAIDLIVVEDPAGDYPSPAAEPFDLNGDGKADIVLRHTKNGKLHLLEMSHSDVMASGDIDRLDQQWQVEGIADFGGDGLGDLLLRHSRSGELMLWEMQGNAPMPNAVLDVPSLDWQVVGVGDFGGDGSADILLRHGQTGNLELWEMDANISTPSDIGPLDPAWTVAGIGDFRGDGKADILLRNSGTGALALWETDRNAAPVSEIGALDPAWDVAGIGDLGGDSKADLVLRNRYSHELELWEMDGNLPTPSSIGVVEQNWAVVQVSDFGGDDRDDILLQDTSSGELHLFEMDGSTATHSPGYRLNSNYLIQPAEE
jgi:PKD repeat protein